jgi:hypothetical protein
MMILQQQTAFAHSETTLNVIGEEEHLTDKKISLVIGHTDEPAYGALPGIDTGRHNFEVRLSDDATKLPLTGASLQVDKYYFKDIKSFNNATSAVDNADEIQKGIAVSPVFGDVGHYIARQVVKEGIYGYRLYGNISYFGVANIPIDTTVFCKSSDSNTTKFNSPGWSGSFGCVENIASTAFPSNNTALSEE